MTDDTRRRILLTGCGVVAGAAAGGLFRYAGGSPPATPLRPPGAGPERAFLASCIRCGQCVEVCPHDTLRLASEFAGRGAGAPFLVARDVPCHLCPEYDEMPCVRACPTDALASVGDLRDVRMGTAHLDETTCWAYTGTMCRACWHACPLPDEAIVLNMRLRPEVRAEACVGCGLCEHACPTDPSSIVVAPPDGES